jgi:phosphopantothenoylcysteine decarboxylase/phosphopantothenate--cysteine ligase
MGAQVLEAKTVLLGVCGGIAAYKAVEVCRRLSDAGASVLPVLTREAARFVGPVTFSALAAEPARTSLFGRTDEPVPHIALARRAQLVVVAPATAQLIGAYAAGICSDLLSATLLATRAPVLLCPSMHTEMWEHPAVQDNVALLRRRGVEVLEPEEGRLAGGDIGKGRLPEASVIVAAAARLLVPGGSNASNAALAGQLGEAHQSGALSRDEAQLGEDRRPLAGVRAVVSAGGTREPLDPVRYIGNRSSGKQGYAVAEELIARGAEVTLVSSSALAPPVGAKLVEVETAAEMADAVLEAAADADLVVMAAAVADYRPAEPAREKVKKGPAPVSVKLVPTVDILKELGSRRRPGQVLVGFAAETASGDRLVELGRSKLVAKGADLVVANDVATPGAGFGADASRAVIVSANSTVDLGLVTKRDVAVALVDSATPLLARARGAGAPKNSPKH